MTTPKRFKPAVEDAVTPENIEATLAEIRADRDMGAKTIVVGSSDTWATIAKRAGVDPAALAKANNTTIHGYLYAGATLHLP